MKIKISEISRIIKEETNNYRLEESKIRIKLKEGVLKILKESAADVGDFVNTVLVDNEDIDVRDLANDLEQSLEYNTIKSFAALPQKQTIDLFRNFKDPKAAWLKTWRAANIVSWAREY